MALSDFEDAVVASLADAAYCDHIITRNETDFVGSLVPAVSPAAFLALFTTVPKAAGGGNAPGNDPA